MWGSVATALTALGALAVAWGLPVPAWSTDIQRLDRQQTETAVDVYRKAVRDTAILKSVVKGDAAAERLVEEDAAEARENLKRAQQRKIELSK